MNKSMNINEGLRNSQNVAVAGLAEANEFAKLSKKTQLNVHTLIRYKDQQKFLNTLVNKP